MSGLHEFGLRGGRDREFAGHVYLHSDFARIAEARSAAQIEAAMRAFAWTTGFDRYGFVTIDDDYSTRDSCVTTFAMHNTPPEFEPWWDDHEFCKTDPVLQHCRRSGAPVVYGQDTYVNCGMGEKWSTKRHMIRCVSPPSFTCRATSISCRSRSPLSIHQSPFHRNFPSIRCVHLRFSRTSSFNS